MREKMLSRFKNIPRKEWIFVGVFVVLVILLVIWPTGYEKQMYVHSEGVLATVTDVDNSGRYFNGLVKQGGQSVTVRIESGKMKGQTATGQNLYIGKMEFDKDFAAGDLAWVLLEFDEAGKISGATMVDHYRIHLEIALVAVFALLMILISGFTGVRTLLSFAFALLAIWKILIPCMLNGINPIVVALVVGNLITVATLLLVAGFTPKAFAAIAGAVACSLLTCVLAIVLGDVFKIHGAVMQWSESLLYAGYEKLNLTLIFQAGIYLACSGAILDLAVDISSALDEVARNHPKITRKELIRSGLTIGRSVVGSQTTTLLLAYMGSYISIMMVFMAQGTPMMNILNSKMIASEILHTFVGCIGLVIVAPLTSVICGFFLRKESLHGNHSF